MSEYLFVEKPFLDQLARWAGRSSTRGKESSRPTRRRACAPASASSLPEVFRDAVRRSTSRPTASPGSPTASSTTYDDQTRQPNRTLLEANEAVQALFLKARSTATRSQARTIRW